MNLRDTIDKIRANPHVSSYWFTTLSMIIVFVFQAVSFCYNNWYLIKWSGSPILECGLWELEYRPNRDLSETHGPKSEQRIYHDHIFPWLNNITLVNFTTQVIDRRNKTITVDTTSWLGKGQNISDSANYVSFTGAKSAERMITICWITEFFLAVGLTLVQFVGKTIEPLHLSLCVIPLTICGLLTLISGGAYISSIEGVCDYVTVVIGQDNTSCHRGFGYVLTMLSGLLLCTCAVFNVIVTIIHRRLNQGMDHADAQHLQTTHDDEGGYQSGGHGHSHDDGGHGHGHGHSHGDESHAHNSGAYKQFEGGYQSAPPPNQANPFAPNW